MMRTDSALRPSAKELLESPLISRYTAKKPPLPTEVAKSHTMQKTSEDSEPRPANCESADSGLLLKEIERKQSASPTSVCYQSDRMRGGRSKDNLCTKSKFVAQIDTPGTTDLDESAASPFKHCSLVTSTVPSFTPETAQERKLPSIQPFAHRSMRALKSRFMIRPQSLLNDGPKIVEPEGDNDTEYYKNKIIL